MCSDEGGSDCRARRAQDRADGSSSTSVVVVALWRIGSSDPEILITRRPAGVHLAYAWELPGGKVEPGESIDVALAREVREELGLTDVSAELLTTVEHRYPDRTVWIHAYLAAVTGDLDLRLTAASEHRWTPLSRLASVPFPEANRPITEAIVRALRREG